MDGLSSRSTRSTRPRRAAPTSRSCARSSTRHAGDLSADVLRLRDVNPLRAFDTQGRRAPARCSPRRPRSPTGCRREAAEHFAAVRAFLDARGVAYRVEPTPRARPRLLHAHRVGDQAGRRSARRPRVSGGGRYDGFAELLGGPPTPGIGFAAGHRADRARARDHGRDAGAAATRRRRCSPQITASRPRGRACTRCSTRCGGRSACAARPISAAAAAKGQFKQADRVGARLVASCGPDEWAARHVRCATASAARATRSRSTTCPDAREPARAASTGVPG